MTSENIFSRIVELSKTIQGNPDDAEARKERATLLSETGMLDDALADVDHVLVDLGLHDADALQLRGSIRMRQGDKDGAFADLQELVKLRPEILQHLSGEYESKKSEHC